MAIGVVVEQPVAEPDHLRKAEVFLQPMDDIVAGQPRIAVVVEQALLGGDDQPRPIAVDCAAFENPVARLGLDPARFRQPLADRVIAGQIIFAAPAIEAEQPRFGLRHHDRAGIAQPDVAERLKQHVGKRRQLRRRIRRIGVGSDQDHLLARAIGVDSLRKGHHFGSRRFDIVEP